MNFVPDTEVMENGTRYSPDSMSGHNKWGDTFETHVSIITFLKLLAMPLKVSKFFQNKNT